MLIRFVTLLLGVSLLAQRLAVAAPMISYHWGHVSGPHLTTWEDMSTSSSNHLSASREALSPEELEFVDSVLVDPHSDHQMHSPEGLAPSHPWERARGKQQRLDGPAPESLRRIQAISPKEHLGFASKIDRNENAQVQGLISSKLFGGKMQWIQPEGNVLMSRFSMRDRSPSRISSRRLPSISSIGSDGTKGELYVTEHNRGGRLGEHLQGKTLYMFWTIQKNKKKGWVHLGTGYIDPHDVGDADKGLRTALSIVASSVRG
ncbi:uncharacterized protein SPSC_06203 [Sporisorium scitamineum]|uniref:Effector family protein Eff1 n=1 Tax=Sporisorium scitamineum TaxID=49012 RepID=A0A0F7S566_9BASI|nr:uncharacterized protein SPSC_06203 [Sporisorium scitamineum]CDW98037.1 hypothetical protein [Sporisorium scitamineum]